MTSKSLHTHLNNNSTIQNKTNLICSESPCIAGMLSYDVSLDQESHSPLATTCRSAGNTELILLTIRRIGKAFSENHRHGRISGYCIYCNCVFFDNIIMLQRRGGDEDTTYVHTYIRTLYIGFQQFKQQ